MTDHHPHSSRRAPTARQQRYLCQLALQRGVSFTPPRTRPEASRLIEQLRRRPPEPIAERRRELHAVQADLARHRGDAARVREDEITGHVASQLSVVAPGAR
jgi:hypothetical protein